MTIDIKELESLKKKYYESFAKEYGIKLREGDVSAQDQTQEQAQDTTNNTSTQDTPAAPEVSPNAEPTPVIPKPKDIAQGVAEDTSLQTTPLKDDGNVSISFESGNLAQLQNSIRDMIKKPGIIERTFLPLVEKALIELLGSSSSYKRTSFIFKVSLLNNIIYYNIEAIYSVDLFIGTDIEQSAVQHDENYIKDTIAVVPNMKIKEVKIDTSTGLVKVSVVI